MEPGLLLLLGLAALLVFQFTRVRRQQREVRNLRSSLEVGAEVVTASGMIGTVTAVDGATVTLTGPDATRTRWVAAAVVRVLTEDDPASSRYAAPDDATGPTTTTSSDAADGDAFPRTKD